MRYFPSTLTVEDTAGFISRMNRLYQSRQHCYFAVEKLDSRTFIGFIGIGYQTFDAAFTPVTDVGWRLHPDHWGKGYASEGARRCLDWACTNLKVPQIAAIAPLINQPSIRVMEKSGMQKKTEFLHPELSGFPSLERCVLYTYKC